MHRFKDDLEWGYILRRLREGNPTKADLQEINSYVVTKIQNCQMIWNMVHNLIK